MSYVDGFVIPVPKANKDAYLKMARECAPVFKKYGAIRLVENWGIDVPHGEVTSFPMAVKLKEDEVVMFSWIVWPSKEVRDKGMEEAMKDPFFSEENMPMPFDGKRMIYGSFETIFDE